ncbi:hypothetical protein CAPTEDRAFT_212836 [Capitella teleta]|uniref:Uncharacterized protein n=1 Tax=Capitella teleta TaxID=283909 RepID=R7UY85_CAPTE|nr:hypothetical protein CAPTEDRAFT_212836 [Capitella teleta]|eukprot:ELU11212.1 hypothetical protein CAPTEDRAFT_212836 [Capitella teleta]
MQSLGGVIRDLIRLRDCNGLINNGNFGTVFVDQSYWQSGVASKPKQGVWGFLLGGITWFAVPFTFATTMGLAYIALDARQDSPLLQQDQIDQGSAEVIAVTSILVYDFYQVYLKPYRLVHDANSCILCGRSRGRNANPRDKCLCISMAYCIDCEADDVLRDGCNRALKPVYKCKMHGTYRTYNDLLLGLKNWCILWTTLCVIPITIVLDALKIALNWVYLFMGVIIGSAVIPIVLSMTWARLTSSGMSSGAIGGSVLGLTAWLISASQQDGGLSNFLESTGHNTSMLVGNLVSIIGGGVIAVVVSLVTNRNYDSYMSHEIWETTRDIDNPLSPWTELYAKDLDLSGANRLDNRPSLDEVKTAFKSASRVAQIGASLLTFIFVLLWPACMVSIDVMDQATFTRWIGISATWGIAAFIFITIMPLISEGREIRMTLREKRSINSADVGKQRVEAAAPKSSPPPSASGSGTAHKMAPHAQENSVNAQDHNARAEAAIVSESETVVEPVEVEMEEGNIRDPVF